MVILPVLIDLVGLCWFYFRPDRMKHRLVNVPEVQLYGETAFYVAVYTGLLCLPLMLGMAGKLATHRDTRVRFGKFVLLWGAILGAVLTFISWKAGAAVPFPFQLAPAGDSYHYNGSVATGYAYVLKEELPFDLPPMALQGLFVISLASAASLLSLFSMTMASSPAFTATLHFLEGLRKRRVFLIAGVILAIGWIGVFLNRDSAFAVGRRMYDQRMHVHSFDEYLPRIRGAYDGLLAELGIAAIGLFVLQFLSRKREQGVLPAEVSPGRTPGYPGPRCALVYLVCLGQALFIVFVNSVTQPFVFRRYVLMFAPGVLLFVLTRRKDMHTPKLVAICSMALLVTYAALSMRGIMHYNKAKWQGASYLLQRGIPPSEINAGLTFTNWYLNAPLLASYDNDYLVISSPFPGYKELKKIMVPGSLSGDLNVYVLEREK